MRRIGFFLLILGGLASLGLAAVYIALSPAFLASSIEQAVASTTGRKVVLESRPHLQLWPQVGIAIKGVKILNPASMAEGVFAETAEMEITIGASALFHRKAEIEEFRLIRPRLNLIVDKQGHASWDLAVPEGNADAAGAPLPIDGALAPIYVDDGFVDFRDERTGAAYTFQHLDLVLKLDSPSGPIDVKGSGEWRKDRASFSLYVKSPQALAGDGSPIDFNVSASRLNLAYSGLAIVRDGLELAGQVEARARSLREFMRWVGFDMNDGRGLGSVTAFGSLSTKGAVFDLKKVRLALDGHNAQGDLTIDASGTRPKIIARLGIDAIDLNQYVPPRDNDSFDLGDPGVEAWSVTPMDFSPLRNFEAEATVSAGRLTYGDVATSNVTVEASIKDGILDARLNSITLYGGTASGEIVLDGQHDEPAIRAIFEGHGIDGRRLLLDFAKFEHIEGRADIALSLDASGMNQQELVGSMKGVAGFTFADGAVRGADARKLLQGVMQNIVAGWHQGLSDKTPFKELKGTFTVTDGIAESTDFQLTGPVARITGTGSVDVLKREIDFKVEPKVFAESSAGQPDFGIGLPVPVVIKGPWANPKIYPDIAGILENPQAAYRALKTLADQTKPEVGGEAVKPVKATDQKGGNVAGERVDPAGGKEQAPGPIDLLKQQFNGNNNVLNGFSSSGSAVSLPEP